MKRLNARGLVAKTHREDAFSLIEVSIVLVILGIILAIATLSYASITRSMNMSGAKKQIEAAMNRAKTAARQENVTYHLVFYTNADGSHANSYEFMHNVKNLDGTWTMTPVDRSVPGEDVTSAGGHAYIGLTNNVLITGCTEISGSVVVVRFTPSGTAMSISGTDAGGVTTTPSVTLNLSSGGQVGGVSITSMGTITSF